MVPTINSVLSFTTTWCQQVALLCMGKWTPVWLRNNCGTPDGMGVPSGHLTCGSSTQLPLASSSSQIPSSSCLSTSVSETVLNNNQASLSQGAFDFCGKENKRQAEDMVRGDTEWKALCPRKAS